VCPLLRREGDTQEHLNTSILQEMEVQNLLPRNEFNEESRPLSNIHIRLRQRNGKKTLTTVEGLAGDLDLKKLLKAFKKVFQTSGAVLKTEVGEVIQLQGDKREGLKDFLVKYKVWESPDPPIKVHGF